jgi:hypothetical protein
MSAFVTVPEFPDVPALPGVPALLRDSAGLLGSLPALELADSLSVLGIFPATQWGIFDQDGNPIVIANSVLGVDFRGDYDISDYPVEQGGFQSYNKVIRPFDVRVTLTCAQSTANRSAFIAGLEQARASLGTFQVVTPEYTYPSVNIIHVDYSRTQRSGANIIIADVWLRQIIQTASSTLSSTQSSSGADPLNGGTVQPADVQSISDVQQNQTQVGSITGTPVGQAASNVASSGASGYTPASSSVTNEFQSISQNSSQIGSTTPISPQQYTEIVANAQ